MAFRCIGIKVGVFEFAALRREEFIFIQREHTWCRSRFQRITGWKLFQKHFWSGFRAANDGSEFQNFITSESEFQSWTKRFFKVVNSLSPFWKKVHVLPLSAICKWRAILENCLTWLWPEIAKLIKSKRPNRLKTSLTPTLLAKKHIYRIWIPRFFTADFCLQFNFFYR